MSNSHTSHAYIIEIDDRAAGIVASDARGFRFFASEHAFHSLEGRHFRSAGHAERAAKAILKARRPAAARLASGGALR
jgi:hypothetical protein